VIQPSERVSAVITGLVLVPLFHGLVAHNPLSRSEPAS